MKFTKLIFIMIIDCRLALALIILLKAGEMGNANILNFYMKNIIKLDRELTEALRQITIFYATYKAGKQTKASRQLRLLKKMGFVFRTAKGWFPSTKGQDYINRYDQ